jgi:hypothetical protein
MKRVGFSVTTYNGMHPENPEMQGITYEFFAQDE